MTRLRVGVVGTGFIAGRHLAALAGFDDVAVVAVADAVPARAEEVAARSGARPYRCLLYTSPSPRDRQKYRMPSSA